MAKKNYVVTRSGSYGDRGKVVELDLGKDGLSDRQKVMLEPYSKPVVMVDNSKELTEANSVNKELADKVAALELANKELTEAVAAQAKAK